MNPHLGLKDFVQNILGCTCPDKVFEQIEDRHVAHSSSPHCRSITIGGRLLIYIWNVSGSYALKENLLAMLEAGKKERDERGLNRFRAVLAVGDTQKHIESEAKSYFSRYAGSDDRMHMHVVSSLDIRDI
jgi:hypothetical protein